MLGKRIDVGYNSLLNSAYRLAEQKVISWSEYRIIENNYFRLARLHPNELENRISEVKRNGT